MNTPRVTVAPLDSDAFWRVTFGARESTGNILDADTMTDLTAVFHQTLYQRHLKAIVLEGTGDHFSYGASVQEHMPDQVAAMLRRFRELLTAALDSSVVLIAAVRGQCLGGGLELATIAHRILARRDATFGQPEISLGVFAPAASLLLPIRIGRARAEALCLTGAPVDAPKALEMGLVDELVDDDPAAAALAWARTHLASKSASSLRLAVKAIRADVVAAVAHRLPEIERLYLEELMKTADAREGLMAFLEKRTPHWSDA